MRFICINCYKCFHEAFRNKPAICNNLLSQDPSSKIFDKKKKKRLIKDLSKA